MEKENYETDEYLPASGSNFEGEPYQFFVVQDDGTFLINRQLQCVVQVQDKLVFEPDQPCTMLDVAPQQFYVDDDTTAGMISVPEQFNGPEGSSNLYGSNYLLQPASETPMEEQIDDNVVDQLKANLQDDSPLPVASNSFTELLQNVNDPKPSGSAKESDTSPKPPKPVQMEIESDSEEEDIECTILRDALKKDYDTYAAIYRELVENTSSDDVCHTFGKLLAKKLEKYPANMRNMIVTEIDAFLSHNPPVPDEQPSSASSSPQHASMPSPQDAPNPSPK